MPRETENRRDKYNGNEMNLGTHFGVGHLIYVEELFIPSCYDSMGFFRVRSLSGQVIVGILGGNCLSKEASGERRKGAGIGLVHVFWHAPRGEDVLISRRGRNRRRR